MELWEVRDAELPNLYFKRNIQQNQAKKRQGVRLKLLFWRVIPRSKVSWIYHIMIASHSKLRRMWLTKFNGSIKKERSSEKIYKEHQRSLFIVSIWLTCTTTTWIMLMLKISWEDPTVSIIGCSKVNCGGLCFSGVFKFFSLTRLLFTKIVWYCTNRSQLATAIFTRQGHWRGSVKMNTGQNNLMTRNALIPR